MYRTIDSSFWDDPRIRKQKTHTKLLFLYLVTNRHTHLSGIYYLPILFMQHETGLTSRQAKDALDVLCEADLAYYDCETDVVWVKRMFRYQGHGEKAQTSAAKHLQEDLHGSKLAISFLNYYPEVRNRVDTGFLDTLSHRVSEVATPEQEQEQNKEQEQSIGSAQIAHPPVVLLPTNKNGEEYPVSQEEANELQECYQAADVHDELRQMRGWLLKNKKRRKTYDGMGHFISTWLGKAQNQARASPTKQQRGRTAREIEEIARSAK